MADDGRDFGFELTEPLRDGAVVLVEDGRSYVIAQRSEAVLELPMTDAAVIGWSIGNLHFQIEVTEGAIRVEDDPALRQLCAREGWSYEACERVFRPRQGGHHHAH